MPAYSWAPNVPGYYQINAVVASDYNSGVGFVFFGYMYKRNTLVCFQRNLYNQQPTNILSTVVYMDGVTDYISIFGYHNTGSNQALGNPGGITNGSEYSFNGCLLRPA